MTSSEKSTRILCSLCNKAKGIYRCEGCSQVFCSKHSIDHRTTLNKQLEEITMSHDLIYQTLNHQIDDPQKHSLILKIDQWEKKSIDLIRETAERIRKESLEGTTEHINNIKQKLQILSNQLNEGREENDFSEIDLRQWIETLEKIKTELVNPTIITLQEDFVSLINNIYIIHQNKPERFERIFNTGQIEDDGRVVIKDNTNGHVEIRGRCEYNAGIRTLYFRIEEFEQNGWFFFGIVTKRQTMQNCSYSSLSSYGWSNRHQIYVSNQPQTGYTLDIAQNDVILLTIDCDQRKIQLTNRRLRRHPLFPAFLRNSRAKISKTFRVDKPRLVEQKLS